MVWKWYISTQDDEVWFTVSWGSKESNATKTKSVAQIEKELWRRKDQSIFNPLTVNNGHIYCTYICIYSSQFLFFFFFFFFGRASWPSLMTVIFLMALMTVMYCDVQDGHHEFNVHDVNDMYCDVCGVHNNCNTCVVFEGFVDCDVYSMMTCWLKCPSVHADAVRPR